MSRTRSARLMVESRWAMIRVVRPSHELAQPVVDAQLDLHVDGAGGVVEDEDRRVDQQGPGDGDALALAAGQGVAPLADDRVVALGQLADELVGARPPWRPPRCRRSRPRACRRRCCPGSRAEKRKGSSSTMPTWARRLSRVRSRTSWPSISHRAAGHVVEAGEQPGHRRLARAGPPDQGDRLARARGAGRSARGPAGCRRRRRRSRRRSGRRRRQSTRSTAPGRSTMVGCSSRIS